MATALEMMAAKMLGIDAEELKSTIGNIGGLLQAYTAQGARIEAKLNLVMKSLGVTYVEGVENGPGDNARSGDGGGGDAA